MRDRDFRILIASHQITPIRPQFPHPTLPTAAHYISSLIKTTFKTFLNQNDYL